MANLAVRASSLANWFGEGEAKTRILSARLCREPQARCVKCLPESGTS